MTATVLGNAALEKKRIFIAVPVCLQRVHAWLAACLLVSLALMLERRPPVCICAVWTTSCVNSKVFLVMSWCGSTPILLDDCGLRALPPSGEQQLSAQPEVTAPTFLAGQGQRSNPVTSSVAVAPLPERIDALNYSMDPWECTGAAPQGWANHLRQSLLPIQGYIQLRPQDATSLPFFGTTSMAPPGGASATDDATQTAPRRLGKASKSVSIFARALVCKDTCRYCRARPCDVAVDHDDHTCYDCEQRLLNPDGEPGAPCMAASATPWLRLLVPPVFQTEMLPVFQTEMLCSRST